MKYIDAEKLITLIDAKLNDLGFSGSVLVGRSVLEELKDDIITSLQQDETQVDKMLCSQVWWEEQGWIMIPPDATIEGIDSLLRQVRKKLQQEQPEPYFYCKYGGTIPLCSDCQRNHNNSSFKTEEITTWYAPSNGTKHCIDYIQQEQPEVDVKKEIDRYCETIHAWQVQEAPFTSLENCAYHFFELGRNARKL